MKCRTKSDFAKTYHFGHNSCNSGPFLLKIGLKCAHFWRVSCGQPVAFETGPFVLFEKHATATVGPVLIGLVQS